MPATSSKHCGGRSRKDYDNHVIAFFRDIPIFLLFALVVFLRLEFHSATLSAKILLKHFAKLQLPLFTAVCLTNNI